MSSELSTFPRIVWLLLNLFFGGVVGIVMLVWVSCDMEIPTFFPPVTPPFLRPMYHLPWFDLRLPLWAKIIFDIALFANFGFVHTFFAQTKVQEHIAEKLSLPKPALRTVYLMLTTTAVWLLIGLWQKTSIQLWDFLNRSPIETDYTRHEILLGLFILITLPGKT